MSDENGAAGDGGAEFEVPQSLTLDGGLYLRPLTLGDVPIVYRTVVDARDELHTWLPWVFKTNTVADTLRFVDESLRERAEGSAYVYGIWLDLEFCGAIDLHSVDRMNRSAQIGYWLKQSARGQGVMTRAAAALLGLAFEILCLERVEVCAAVGNEKSAAIPLRLGFREEGIRRHAQLLDSGYADLRVFGLLAHEYRQQLGGDVDLLRDEIESGLEF